MAPSVCQTANLSTDVLCKKKFKKILILTHALRVGFITAAYDGGVRDEDIMRHTRHRDLRTMRGYVQRAGLVAESPAGKIDL